MPKWVTLKNIEDFKRKLAEEKDPERRRILEEFLAKEQVKLTAAR
jgi:hypothetical protein